jgi:hypothetical protein
MINVAKERNFVRRVRKWNGPLFNNYSFHAFTDSKTPQIVVLIERIYKGRNGKKVHVGLDLNQEKPIAVTVMPESLPAIVELSFPSWNVWEQCEDLVPPFTKIYPVSKRKGGVKLVALGCLFQTDAQKMDSTLNNVLKALVAATKAEIYLQQILKVSHSDIKPANIFISAEGKFQLGDFGHVTVLGNPTRGGTFGFKAPEDTITRIKGAFSAIWEIGMTGIELMNSSIRIKFLRSKHHYSTFSQDFLNQFINFQQKEAEKRYKNCKESILWHDLFDLCAECLRMNPEERPSLFKILKGFEQLQCEDHQKRRISEEEKQRSFKRFTKMLVKASQEDPI